MLFIGGALCSTNVIAQEIDSNWLDIDFIKTTEPWLESKNAAGLQHFQFRRISSASAFVKKANGDFKNFNASGNSFDAGASTSSIYRLNDKVVLNGGISYHHFSGKNMGGSAFIDPYQNPFDIVESDDFNRGTKKLESYILYGAVSAVLTKRLRLGARMSYETANFAKAKDLRHTNKLLDMDLSAGLSYILTPALEIGANYTYDRRIESIAFGRFGNVDRQFLSLINYGAFFGRTELFTNTGYTAENAKRPMVNITNGGSLQLGITFNDKLRLFNEFSYGKTTGYFGVRGTNNVVYTEHRGEQFSYTGVLSLNQKTTMHRLKLRGSYGNTINSENIYRTETDAGNTSTTVYFGSTELYNQDLSNAGLEYLIHLNMRNNVPAWTFTLGADYTNRQRAVTIYPFYRDQTIEHYQVQLSGKRQIIRNKDKFGLIVNALYGSGSGILKYDGLYTPPSSTQVEPSSMDLYLNQEYEFFTSKRVQAGAGFQYSRMVKPGLTPFMRIDYSYTKAFDLKYLGDHFQTLTATIGCNF